MILKKMPSYNLKKISKLLAEGHELVIDFQTNNAYIWLEKKNYYIPFSLAYALSINAYFTLDGGDEDYDIHVFIFDWQSFRDDGIKGENPEKSINEIFNRFEAANQNVHSLEDLW